MGFSNLTPEDDSYQDKVGMAIIQICDIKLAAKHVVAAVDEALDDDEKSINTSGKSGDVIAHGDICDDGDGYLIFTPHSGVISQTPLLSLPEAKEFAEACIEYYQE